jgi:hypothetical protein
MSSHPLRIKGIAADDVIDNSGLLDSQLSAGSIG